MTHASRMFVLAAFSVIVVLCAASVSADPPRFRIGDDSLSILDMQTGELSLSPRELWYQVPAIAYSANYTLPFYIARYDSTATLGRLRKLRHLSVAPNGQAWAVIADHDILIKHVTDPRVFIHGWAPQIYADSLYWSPGSESLLYFGGDPDEKNYATILTFQPDSARPVQPSRYWGLWTGPEPRGVLPGDSIFWIAEARRVARVRDSESADKIRKFGWVTVGDWIEDQPFPFPSPPFHGRVHSSHLPPGNDSCLLSIRFPDGIAQLEKGRPAYVVVVLDCPVAMASILEFGLEWTAVNPSIGGPAVDIPRYAFSDLAVTTFEVAQLTSHRSPYHIRLIDAGGEPRWPGCADLLRFEFTPLDTGTITIEGIRSSDGIEEEAILNSPAMRELSRIRFDLPAIRVVAAPGEE